MGDVKCAGVLLADPPWPFGDSLPGKARGAAKHYRTLSVSDIARFSLPPLATDCALVLWRVSAMTEEAFFVARAWGFHPKSEIVWVKTKPSRPEEIMMGMGRTVRLAHEVAIIATRGRPKVLAHDELSVIVAPRGEHSRKPVEMYDKLERLFAGPYVELFAREQRKGWRCYGDELPLPVLPVAPEE